MDKVSSETVIICLTGLFTVMILSLTAIVCAIANSKIEVLDKLLKLIEDKNEDAS